MNSYCKEVIQKLEEELYELSIELDVCIPLCEVAIELIVEKMAEVKAFVLKNGFSNEEEEVLFQKIKAVIVSKLIYYNTIYKIETKKPYGGDKTIKEYLNNELAKLKRYFDNNLDFYKYYTTNSTYLDYNIFCMANNYDIKLSLYTFYFEADHSFSTSHDYKVAKILANDLIQIYL